MPDHDVPSMDEIRAYAITLAGWVPEAVDSALAAHDAEVRAQALRDAADVLSRYSPRTPTPTVDAAVADWLNRRADREAEGSAR